MKLALNGATIMQSSIQGDIEIARACGYGAIEFWAAKIDAYLATGGSLAELRDQVVRAGLTPWCINSVENITARDSAGRDAVLDELRGRVAIARALRAPSIVVVPSCRDERIARSDAVGEAIDVLREMSDVAGEIVLAFEFLGKPGCTVPTLDMAIDIVNGVDRPNVALVIDVFHFHAGGSSFDDLQRVPIEKLAVVHLNGAEELPRGELTDAHRLYPGEGVIPAAAIVRVLRERGFDGVASVEIFRPEYWEQDAREVATAALRGARSVLAEAGMAT